METAELLATRLLLMLLLFFSISL